jgi:hypothetical protein
VVANRAEVDLLGDKGYQGAGGTLTSPHKGRDLTAGQKAHNRMVNTIRGPGERGSATVKSLAHPRQGRPSAGR